MDNRTGHDPHGFEGTHRFELRSDEAMSLKIAERFFSEISNYLLREREMTFDVAIIKECLREMRENVASADDDNVEQSDKKLQRELEKWRELLIKKDLDIEAFEIRRFCDSFGDSLDAKIFFSVARFYRAIPISTSSQCKFDLMMTRAFEVERVGNARFARFDRVKIADKIRELYSSWPECGDFDSTRGGTKTSAVSSFDEFIAEANRLMHFEDLIASNIFERIRELKRSLGQDYFLPENVAAAIDCNIIVGNTFGALLAQLNSNLHIRLNSQIDFAGVLIDGSATGHAELIDILGALADPGELALALSENSDLAILQMFLRHSTLEHSTHEPGDLDGEAEEDPSDQPAVSLVKQRLAPQLETLTHEQPNAAILRDYMRTSAVLDALDLSDFLFAESGGPDVLGRRALAAILCLEEFKENDLKTGTQLEPEVSNEMLAMLHFAERVGDDLNEEFQRCEPAMQPRVLVVTNKLLNSRLQVERAVVRFATPVEEIKEVEPETPVEEFSWPDDNFGINKTAFLESSRWLMAATILVALVCGSIILFTGRSSTASTLAVDVQEVSTTVLPNSERLEQAIRKDETLFVTAKDSWENLDEDEKRASLQKMLEVDPDKPLKVAIVVDPNGRPLADISPVGVTVHAEPRQANTSE